MRQSVINYVKENGIKLAANSKALKLINNGASEAEVAVALLQNMKLLDIILILVIILDIIMNLTLQNIDSRK